MNRLLAVACVGLLATVAFADVPAEGSKAPDFDLPATQIEKVLPSAKGAKTLKLSDLNKNGKNVVLYFYPKAMTRGCTVESCGFRDVYDQFAKLDTVVLGISTDTLAEQQQFTDKEKLNFPLIADPEKKVTQAYGALSRNGVNASRYTFIIDKQGIVRKVYTTVNPEAHPPEVLAFVKEKLK